MAHVIAYKKKIYPNGMAGGGGGSATLEMCDYAEFNGTRITLPFTISADYTVEVDFDADVYFDNQYVIGNTSGASLLHLTQYGGRWYCSGGSGETNFAKATTGRHTFKCNYNNKNWFDGEEVTNYTPTTDSATLLIGGRGSEGNYQGKIYNYKITSISTGDTLLDLKPAKLIMAGVIVKEGLYDSVSQKFIENSLVTVGND